LPLPRKGAELQGF